MGGSSVVDGGAVGDERVVEGGVRGVEGGVVEGGGDVFVARKPLGGGSRGGYRRVARYCKSVARWRLERARRREVIRLRLEGKSLVEIAVVLGVSLRTVKRDFARVKPYLKSQLRVRRLQEEQRRMEAMFGGMSTMERFEALEQLLRFPKKRRRVGKPEEPARVVLVVDVDAALQGKAGLECVPRSWSSSGNGRGLDLEVRLVIHGKLVKMGGICFRSNIAGEDNRMTLSKADYDRLFGTGRV